MHQLATNQVGSQTRADMEQLVDYYFSRLTLAADNALTEQALSSALSSTISSGGDPSFQSGRDTF
mgnify:CR=1 FL=1